MIARLLLLAGILFTALPSAGQSVFAEYKFDNAEQKSDFKELTAQLRCLVCQNQNIADSNAPLAQDLRREIHEMLTDGQSKHDVIDFMVQRYGEFVLYKPMMSVKTLALWFGPALFFAFGLVAIWRMTRRPVKAAVAGPDRHALAEARRLLDNPDARDQ